jgi:translation initiation factor IF-1
MPDARREGLEIEGTVVEALPNALFRVQLGDERRTRVVAHVAASSSLLRVLPGDEVVVALASYDAGRGRIVRRRS